MIKLLDGKMLSEKIYAEIKDKVSKLNYVPKLVVISVGDDQASKVYIRNKKNACEKCGIRFEHLQLDSNKLDDEALINVLAMMIDDYNKDDEVDGIIIQKPMGFRDKSLENLATSLIDPDKDVDGFSAPLVLDLFQNEAETMSCTPQGIISLIKEYGIELEGKNVVIIGRSTIVGKPLALAMLNENATITVCHSKTKNLRDITKNADILVSAIGRAKMIDSSYIGDNCKVIIDVGMNRDENNKLCGDVDYNDIINSKFNTYYTTYITPVPGGVGPMTVASLVQNVLTLSMSRREIQ